nr:MAG TPA: hypothetical protein [Caudoviricetes sp.]
MTPGRPFRGREGTRCAARPRQRGRRVNHSEERE